MKNGVKIWYLNDQLHRVGRPAIEWSDVSKWWYQNDQLHREDGPDVKYWYQNDQLHRLDGPAIEYANGDKYWYLHGKKIECETQEEFLRLMKLKAFW